MAKQDFRIGFGYDIHKFSAGRKLILGGVMIPYHQGLQGHSDADVLLHSLCDAILGAAGFDDIGHQFPNTDKKYKNISSLILLEKTFSLISAKKWKIGNTDSMIILEKPKLFNYYNKMKSNISGILKTKNVSLKATTSEGLGFIGTRKGCAAYSVALLYK